MNPEAPWLDAPAVDNAEPWNSSPIVDTSSEPWKSSPEVPADEAIILDAAEQAAKFVYKSGQIGVQGTVPLLPDITQDINNQPFLGPQIVTGSGANLTAWEALNQPVLENALPRPQGDEYAGIRKLEDIVEGAVTPFNAGLAAILPGLGGISSTAAKVVSAGFAAQMGKHLVDTAPDTVKAIQEGDLTKAGEGLVDLGTTALMTVGAASHGLGYTRVAGGRPPTLSQPTLDTISKRIADPNAPITAVEADALANAPYEASDNLARLKRAQVVPPVPVEPPPSDSVTAAPEPKPPETPPAPSGGESLPTGAGDTTSAEGGTPEAVTPARVNPLDQLRELEKDAEPAPIESSKPANPEAEKMVSDLDKVGRVNRDKTAAIASELKYYSEEERSRLQEHLGTKDAEPDTLAQAISGRPKLKEKTTVSEYVDEPGGAEGRGHPTADVAKEAFGEDYTGGPGAMGPREAAAMEAAQKERNTGLKRAVVDTERLTRDAEPIPTPERQHEEGVVQAAEDKVDADPSAAPSLVARIVDGGEKAITEHDAAVLLVERQRLMNQRATLEENLADPETSLADKAAAKDELEKIEPQMERLDQAQRAAGTTWGRLGHMYQRMIRDDFTLEGMERQERAAKQRPLTEDERAKIKEQFDKISERQKQLDAAEKQAADERVDSGVTATIEATINELGKEYLEKPKFGQQVLDIAQGIVERWKTEANVARKSLRERLSRASSGVDPTIVLDVAKIMRSHIGEVGLKLGEVSARLLDEFGENVRPYLNKAWEKAKKFIEDEKAPRQVKEAAKSGAATKIKGTADLKARAKAEAVAGDPLSKETVGLVVRSLIKQGVHGEDALMKGAHEALKEAYPDITERDVRRAYSDYGKVKFPSKEAVATEMRELTTLVRLQESIDRATKDSLDPLHTGLQRDKATQLVREKTKQLNELLKKRQGPPSPEKLASREEAKQTALKNRIEDLDKQLRTGEKSPKSEPSPDSPETEQLKAERDAMVEKLKEIVDAANPGKTAAEKQVDQLEKARSRLDEVLSGKRPPNAPKDWTPLSDAAEGLKGEIQAMHELAAQMKRDAKPPTDAAARAENLKIKALEDSIKNYEEKLAISDFSTKGKKASLPDTKKAADLRAIRDARAAAYDAANKAGKPVRTAEEIYNSARLKAINKRIAELQDKISRGDFSKTVRPPTPKLNPEVQKAKLELEQERLKFRRGVKQSELARRGRVEKLMDGLAKWNRAFILSGIHTLAKLSSAAAEIVGLAPIEEAVGGVISKAIPSVSGKAPRHGGFSPRAEINAVVGTWKNLFRDAASNFKTGHTDIDLLYGKPDLVPRELKDYIGNIHAALKSPAKRNEFIRSFEKRAEHAARNGADLTDPLVQTRLSMEAYRDANKSIFREDNIVVDVFNRGMSALRKTNPVTGRPSVRGKAAETLVKIALPIVRIPTNIVSRTLEYSLGSVSGSARLARAMTKGIENLHPDEADAILRNLKRGSVGAALLAYGYFNPDSIGGYYQEGEKRKPGDVKAGELTINGISVPKYLIHNPVLEQLQIGATVRRVADSKLRKKDQDKQGITTGIMAASVGVLEEAPFVNETFHISKFRSPHERFEVAGDFAKNVIPQGVQQVASMTDKDSRGETVSRKPRNIGESIKTGIPILRKTVPIKPNR